MIEQRNMRYTARLSSLFAIALLAAGCSDQPARYPVSGKVLIDGKPLATGTIRFVPESGRPVTSAIMADGSFSLAENSLSSSRLTEGVMPGMYRVSITATKILDEDTDQVEWLVPSQYTDFRTSGIEMEIDQAHDDLVVGLTSEVDGSVETGADHQDESDGQSETKADEQEAPEE